MSMFTPFGVANFDLGSNFLRDMSLHYSELVDGDLLRLQRRSVGDLSSPSLRNDLII